MKLSGDMKAKLRFYLRYLKQKKEDYQIIIKILNIILDESKSHEALQAEIPCLIDLTTTLNSSDAIEACNVLGICYLEGFGVQKDSERAENLFQQAAKQGSIVAKSNLGNCYQQIGSTKQAVAFYQQGAAQGFAESQSQLAFFYEKGIGGITRDLKYAMNLYQQAAAQGWAEAQLYLADCYSDGFKVTKDLKRAAELSQQAAAQGLPRAQNKLRCSYAVGYGVKKDLRRTGLLYQDAIKHGYDSVQIAVTSFPQEGLDLHIPKPEEAVVYYTKLLRDEDKEIASSALSTLAFCYQMGLGIEQDLEQAARLYKQAVKKCYSGSLWDLLLCYRQMSSINQEVVLEFYKRLKTPFSRYLDMNCERISCLAYLSEYGAPPFNQDLGEAYEYYKKIIEHDKKIQAEAHSALCFEERIYAKGKMAVYTPLYQFYKFYNIVREACTQQQGLEGIAPSLISQYAFEEDLEDRAKP